MELELHCIIYTHLCESLYYVIHENNDIQVQIRAMAAHPDYPHILI